MSLSSGLIGKYQTTWYNVYLKITYWGNFLSFFSTYLSKKYLYGINHKRLGLYYFYFSIITGMSGAILATAIRFEMALPGSLFFGGDSLRYLQVITAHALIMIFFVVVPIFFGGFANFLLPYHVGSKDVAFPRLNSLGFWIQPVGYLLIAKIGMFRAEFWMQQDKIKNYFLLKSDEKFASLLEYTYDRNNLSLMNVTYSYDEEDKVGLMNFQEIFFNSLGLNLSAYKKFLASNFTDWATNEEDLDDNVILEDFWTQVLIKETFDTPWWTLFWKNVYDLPESSIFFTHSSNFIKRRKRYIVKCSNASQTVSGWTFITPFSSQIRFTGLGVQDMLILGVYYAGISTTISFINLLVTRRTLTMSGLRSRRVLVPFISTSILLMLRTLVVITPVLGTAMIMLLMDRHWFTSFFDFSYGGDPVFFHHLFWFFGHPEVYVLVIPAFGVINSILPMSSLRRIASKHHLIWAIYIMNYMGFLVWGHHMYLIGLDHRSRALYSTITIMISMPATIKVVNWTFTLISGFLKKDTILLTIISFIFFFLVAGFTGMWLSHVSLNISMHDTLYVVAHFHLMLSGAVLISIFGGFYFYYILFFFLKYSRTLSYCHVLYYSSGQWLTFIPMFWVSFSGLPRRLHDYPSVFSGWQGLSTVGHLITMIGVFAFYGLFIESSFEKKALVNPSTIIARLNRRILYILYKIVYTQVFMLTIKVLPSLRAYKRLLNSRKLIGGY